MACCARSVVMTEPPIDMKLAQCSASRLNRQASPTSPKPPSTIITWPMTMDAASLQRNATASATSSGVTRRWRRYGSAIAFDQLLRKHAQAVAAFDQTGCNAVHPDAARSKFDREIGGE